MRDMNPMEERRHICPEPRTSRRKFLSIAGGACIATTSLLSGGEESAGRGQSRDAEERQATLAEIVRNGPGIDDVAVAKTASETMELRITPLKVRQVRDALGLPQVRAERKPAGRPSNASLRARIAELEAEVATLKARAGSSNLAQV